MWKHSRLFVLQLVLLCIIGPLMLGCRADDKDEEPDDEYKLLRQDPHRDPSLCEVCKYLTNEVKVRLAETGKTHEVLETGYGLDEKKKRKQYKKSELRLIEVINDPHVCDKILEYNIHAERKGSLRYAKGMSETMSTLHGLVHKGVKVELGIPYELWDTPSAGVTEMQRQCFKIVENYEDDIENWYWNHQDVDFTKFLCENLVLKENDRECLAEEWTGVEKLYKEDKDDSDKKKPKKSSKKDKKLKGDVGAEESVAGEDDKLKQDDVSTAEDKDEL